jgi:hypothetical protein
LKTNAVLKALLEMDGVTDEQREAFAGFDLDTMVTQDASNARAAADRKKAEKKAAALQAELDELREEADHASASGSTELEKAQRMAEKMTKRAADAEAKAQEASKAMAEQARTIGLGGLTSQITWSKDVSPDARNLLIQNAFKEFDTEDLGNADLTGSVINSFTTNNPAFIAKQGSGGTGSTGGNADGSGAPKSFTKADLQGKDAAWFRENEAALVAAQQRGEI